MGTPIEFYLSNDKLAMALKWSKAHSPEDAIQQLTQMSEEDLKIGLHVSQDFETARIAVDTLNYVESVCKGEAQWMYRNAKMLPGQSGDYLAYYNPLRWSRLMSIRGVVAALEALPVVQQPVRVLVHFVSAKDALHKLEARRAADQAAEAQVKVDVQQSTEKSRLETERKLLECVSPYFRRDEFKELDPLALRILSYWFGNEYDGHGVSTDQYDLWFGKSAETDEDIRAKFKDYLVACADGQYDHWAKHPLGVVALAILMDQFPRNIYRNSPRSFSYDWKALATVWPAIRAGMDDRLQVFERVWLYLVFTHAEDLHVQQKCVELGTTKLEEMDENWKKMWIVIFEKHEKVIKDFGRFPHRNVQMYRDSTEEEAEFVKDERFRFDLPVQLTIDPDTGKPKFTFVAPGEAPPIAPAHPALGRTGSVPQELG